MKKTVKRFSRFLFISAVLIFSLIIVGESILPENIIFYDQNTKTQVFGIYHLKEKQIDTVSVLSSESMSCKADISLLGIFPAGEKNAVHTERKYVNVGGDIIGIRLYTDGLLVVGCDEVDTSGGNVSPAESCGIKAGDIILEANGKPVLQTEDFVKIIEAASGNEVNITVIRNNNKINLKITPVFSISQNKYRCGLWLRDSTAGIGTLTFADSETGTFASLGHAICDNDTQLILPVGNGDILTAEISGITVGQKGATGQIKGNFGSTVIGELKENNEYGVYGTFSGDKILYGELLPVASQTEIKTDKAQIICNVDGNGRDYYDIEIEKITYSDAKASRSMIIKITDESLISKTGGIIQGMSGSPIIQNGMLVGAVTHVFLNDPTRGYGIFAETMIETAKSVEQSQGLKDAG